MIDPRVRYSLEVLLGSSVTEELPVVYGDPGAGRSEQPAIQIIPSGFFGPIYGTPSSVPELPLKQIEGVPLLFGEPEVVREGSRLIVRADLVASAYFLLTRYEEWVRRDVRDGHGRFPGRESLPCRAGFIDRPIVEEYGALLRRWAAHLGIVLPEPPRQFSVLLTYDIDFIGIRRQSLQPLRSILSGLLGRQSLRRAFQTAAIAAGYLPDPWDNLDSILPLHRSLTEGSFSDRCQVVCFFMAGGRTALDNNYNLRGPRARRAIERVKAAGAEIGLHASYEAGLRPELIASERAELEEVAGVPVFKNRHHYLAWREPEHGAALRAAGITWDSTLGYADVAGFRLGVCHPIPLFDPVHCRPLGIEEHPLIVMECSLSNQNYMNLNEEDAFRHVCKLLSAIHRHRGQCVLLWHTQVFTPTDPTYQRRLYPRVLQYLAQVLGEGPGRGALQPRAHSGTLEEGDRRPHRLGITGRGVADT